MAGRSRSPFANADDGAGGVEETGGAGGGRKDGRGGGGGGFGIGRSAAAAAAAAAGVVGLRDADLKPVIYQLSRSLFPFLFLHFCVLVGEERRTTKSDGSGI